VIFILQNYRGKGLFHKELVKRRIYEKIIFWNIIRRCTWALDWFKPATPLRKIFFFRR